ncbi:DUF3320 domain-containing protein [Cohnella lubricantis]
MEKGTSSLVCDWNRLDVVNFAMQQNFVPVITKIVLRNDSDQDLRQVTVRINADPAFAPPWSKTVDLIPASRAIELGPVPLQISGTFLAELTERLTGALSLSVLQGDELLYQDSSPLTLLAYDQWSGQTIMPEMLAAFIMPNHPAVLRIIKDAAPLLEKWTGNPSFDAYQSRNPNRIRQQAAAIFSTIQSYQPTYVVDPASYEEVGQRIRLPDAIVANQMGNCLDLTLLFTACLEAVGLHSLVIIIEGHAFPGVWLIEETFPESLQDDISLLTKRMAAGVHEISLAEATLMCTGSHSSYQEAEQAAAVHLTDPDKFVGLVDVRRTRASGIRPIPVRIPTPNGWEILQEQKNAPTLAEAPEEVTVLARPVEVSSIALTKQKQWERKLLDLTLRNTLLNFRLTKSALPLLNFRLNELEDALAEGQEFQLLPKPEDWDRTPRSVELFQSMSNDHPLTMLVQEEFRHHRLRADANGYELTTKAIHLYRSARISLEENGANTLYLALGLLRWYESDTSEKPRYAPIVLVPAEIIRKTSSAGFLLRMRDEEPQINITLLEMLRQDFGIDIGGLDPLPRDEKGIDLSLIFTTIRHAVMNKSRWDVLESAFLGLFSFSRFVMWNDIRTRADDLSKNKVVASLMSGRLEWAPGETFPNPSELDERYSPDRLLLPISADSSQITAVSAATQGNSFVLHGPPGTGKSQTITNLIAAALADGKTVLFVAEKMAALSVVQSRLESIGLGPFCLELHSNKSTKKAVLEQLRRTLETANMASPHEWRREADRIAASRSELNGYVASLHRQYGFGASLYEAIARYSHVRTAPGCVSFEAAIVGAMTPEKHAAWTDRVRELRIAGEAAGHPAGNPWEGAACTDYTPAYRSEVEGLLDSYAAKLTEIREAYADVTSWLGAPLDTQPTRESLLRLQEVGDLLRAMPVTMAAALLGAAQPELACDSVKAIVSHGRARDNARSQITSRFTVEALNFDAALALSEWKKAELQWFLPKWLKQHRIGKMLGALAVAGSSNQKKDTAAFLSLILQYQAEAAEVKRAEPQASALLGSMWQGGEADWESVDAANNWTLQLHQALLHLYRDGGQAAQTRERLIGLLSAGRGAFLERCGRSLANYEAAVRSIVELEGKLSDLLHIDFDALDDKRDLPWLDNRQRKAQQWLGAIDRLRNWCSWRQTREQALEAGLTSLVAAYEGGLLQHSEVMPAFERAWWQAAIDFILSEDPQLASFSGRLFEERIKNFEEMADRYEKLTRQEIAARLSANLPQLQQQASSNSEAGILLRAIRSGGRGLSLRKLFEQTPNLLSRLCPCILMSPMSVAQYLDPKYAPFELVVFDEASQLPTSEAVGAMARGRNVIVVGDPNQLPPTSFFSSASSDDGEDAIPEDLESILDDCLALGMPQEHLLWHYRSRHESLIAFSNHHFYENKLLTFPSPFERTSNVRWHPVEGYYDRGRTKQNRAEAEQVVEEIVRRLRDSELSKLSVGVVTFNSIQQGLIEDLLDEAFRKDGELERIAAELYEPIFVKNLENVQGDERDVILFSIGYGPDANGKVVLNFGPLNREGGWRRLNVAVSRARREMHVYSSLRSEHLDVSRTRARGVGALKSFLEYAEKGQNALSQHADRQDTVQPGIEAKIAEALAAEGYKADLHVGASGYRMDLAIVDPNQPDVYILAVLCDGDSYRAGKTARDREVLREQVLKQLGWRIHRVWSMDWLDNPNKVKEQIVEAVKMAQSASNDKALRLSPKPIPVTAEQRSEKMTLSDEQPLNRVTKRSAWLSVYRPVVLAPVMLPSEAFYEPSNERILKSQIGETVQAEGPISKQLLMRRVLQAWGISRTGARIERHFDKLLQAMGLKRTTWRGIDYYWPQGTEPEQYGVYRLTENDQDRRSADELPPEEIANAVREVLFNQGSLPLEDLVRETVKMLGYSRTGAALDQAVRSGIEVAARRGVAVLETDRVLYRRA